MRLKQITLAASSFFFSCHLLGATYAPPELDLFNKPPLFNSIDSMLQPEPASTQGIKKKLTQEYIEVSKLLGLGEIKAGINKLDQLIQQYPQEANFYNLLAASDWLKKDYSRATKNYQKAIELSPNNIRSHIGLATVYLQIGETAKAKKEANIALSIDNNSVFAYLVLADVVYKEGNPKEAERILITASKKAKGDSSQEIKTALMLVNYYKLQQQPKKALSVAQKTNKEHKNNYFVLSLLAKTQIYNKQEEQAIVTLEQIIKKESKDVEHRLLLAKILLKYPAKKQQILKLLDEANSLLPDNVQLQIQRAAILKALKLFPQALQVSKEVKVLAPESGLGEVLEGAIYWADNKPDLALAAFQKSYQKKLSAEALTSIVKIMSAQGKQSAALAFLEKEVKKDTNNVVAHFLMGDIYLQQNKGNEAEKHYLAVLAKEPDNVIILNNLAWIYNQKNSPKALELIEKAYNTAPSSADVLDTYGAILVKQGDVTKGIEMYAQASKINPLNYNTQYHLAHAYTLNAQNKQAVQILRTITNGTESFSEKESSVILLKKLEQ